MARVDVVIPCYKYGKYLRQCVRSVLGQEGVDVRALIIDDCSPDDTPEVARQLMAEDARVEYRRNPVNIGHIATYNVGLLTWASGDYCSLLSADDMLTPNALRRAVRVMDANPQVGFVYGIDVHFTDSDKLPRLTKVATDAPYQIVNGQAFIAASCARGQNLVPTPTVLIRTSLQKRIGGYKSELPHTGDMEMWLRAAAHADVARIDAEQAFYRVHAQNMHVRQFGTDLAEIAQRKAAFDALFADLGHLIPGAPDLSAAAGEALALDALSAANSAPPIECRRLLALASTSHPGAPRLREYRRIRWKLRLGRGLTRPIQLTLGCGRVVLKTIRRPFAV